MTQTTKGYETDDDLKARKNIHKYADPYVDLEKEVYNFIDFKKDNIILDAGCGYGDLLLRLKNDEKFQGELHGIDKSQGLINKAKEKDSDTNFQQGDIKNLPYPDNYFDVIISKHVLHLVDGIKEAVDEAYRCLKPKGSFIVVLDSKNDRPKRHKFMQLMSEKLDKEFEDDKRNICIEDFKDYTSKFSNVKLKKLPYKLKCPSLDVVVNYFNTLSYHFDPEPPEEKWSEIMNTIKNKIEREIRETGKFTDDCLIGVFKVRK